MNRCFVHIGAPKTGSSFLQRLLCENRSALAAAGVLYPDVSLRGYGHHDLAFLLGGGYPEWATPQPLPLSELVGQLATAVSGHRGAILLSSENFFLFPQPDATRRALQESGALDDRRATIVVYLRAQTDLYESWYNQIVKAQGATQPIETYFAAWDELWDYERQVAKWAATFGDENIVVRPYEVRQFTDGTLAADFLSVIGVSADTIVIPSERVNVSLNRDVLEFARLVNRLPLTFQEKRRFHHELMELCERTAGSGLFDEGPVLTNAQRQAIHGRYHEGNAKVAARYVGSSELFHSGGEPVAESTFDHLTAEKLATIAGWLLIRGR